MRRWRSAPPRVVELPGRGAWLASCSATPPTGRRGRRCTIGVVAGSGGAGATTFAAPWHWSRPAAAARVLVDLDPLGPGVDRVVGLDPLEGAAVDRGSGATGGVARTASGGTRWSTRQRRLGSRSLRAALPSRDGLAVLTWAAGRPEAPDAGTVREVLSAAQRGHDVVVVDLPAAWSTTCPRGGGRPLRPGAGRDRGDRPGVASAGRVVGPLRPLHDRLGAVGPVGSGHRRARDGWPRPWGCRCSPRCPRARRLVEQRRPRPRPGARPSRRAGAGWPPSVLAAPEARSGPGVSGPSRTAPGSPPRSSTACASSSPASGAVLTPEVVAARAARARAAGRRRDGPRGPRPAAPRRARRRAARAAAAHRGRHRRARQRRRGGLRRPRPRASSCTDVRFPDDAAVRRLAQRLAARSGGRLDDATPYVDLRLPDGTRFHAVLAPLARPGTVISLRVPRARVFTLDELRGRRHAQRRRRLGCCGGWSRPGWRSWSAAAPAPARRPCSRRCCPWSTRGTGWCWSRTPASCAPTTRTSSALEARPANVEGAGEVPMRVAGPPGAADAARPARRRRGPGGRGDRPAGRAQHRPRRRLRHRCTPTRRATSRPASRPWRWPPACPRPPRTASSPRPWTPWSTWPRRGRSPAARRGRRAGAWPGRPRAGGPGADVRRRRVDERAPCRLAPGRAAAPMSLVAPSRAPRRSRRAGRSDR